MTRQSLWNPAAGHDPMRQLLNRLFDAAEGNSGNDDSSVVTVVAPRRRTSPNAAGSER